MYSIGKIDSEVKLITKLNIYFKGIKFNTIEDFQNLNLDEIRKKDLEIIDKKIEKIKKKNMVKNQKLNSLENELKRVMSMLKKKHKNTAHQNKYFEKSKNKLRRKTLNLKQGLSKINLQIQLFLVERKKIIDLYLANKKILKNVREDKEILYLLSAGIGEKIVKNFIEKKFSKEKEFYLINGFNLNLLGEGIYFESKTLSENRIDHLIVCDRGIFIIETKSWNTVIRNYVDNVLKQLKKSREVFEKVFEDDINNALDLILIYTKKQVFLPKDTFKSLNLNDFLDFVLEKDKILNKYQINKFMYKFSFYLDKSATNTYTKYIFLIRASFFYILSFFRK